MRPLSSGATIVQIISVCKGFVTLVPVKHTMSAACKETRLSDLLPVGQGGPYRQHFGEDCRQLFGTDPIERLTAQKPNPFIFLSLLARLNCPTASSAVLMSILVSGRGPLGSSGQVPRPLQHKTARQQVDPLERSSRSEPFRELVLLPTFPPPVLLTFLRAVWTRVGSERIREEEA
jgi:hypothetical protein